MNTSTRHLTWIAAFAVVAVLMWFAFARRTDAPQTSSATRSAAGASVPATPINPPTRKAVVQKIATQVSEPDLPEHPLPAWDAPFGQSIAELRKWSDAGDANAQVELTERLKLCLPSELKQAEFLDEVDRGNMERADHDPRRTDEQRAAMREATQSRIDRNAEIRDVCARLPKDLLDHWLDPADRAAQAGDVWAMLAYAKAALSDYGDVASIAANIDEVIERRDKARAYLEEAARRGDQHALVMLAETYADVRRISMGSPLYEKDPSAAYAYALAASRNADGTSGDRRNMEWLMAESAKKLDAQALARAQAEGERLYQQCCAAH